MEDLLPVFIDLKMIKCPLQPMRQKPGNICFPQVDEMCLKSQMAQPKPSSAMFVYGNLDSGPLHDLVDRCHHCDEVVT